MDELLSQLSAILPLCGVALLIMVTLLGVWEVYADAMQRDEDEAKRLKEDR